MSFPGTKVQIKPSLNSENPELVDKVQLILKWGGEATHSAKHQASDVGEQMRQNLKLLNREALMMLKCIHRLKGESSLVLSISLLHFLD